MGLLCDGGLSGAGVVWSDVVGGCGGWAVCIADLPHTHTHRRPSRIEGRGSEREGQLYFLWGDGECMAGQGGGDMSHFGPLIFFFLCPYLDFYGDLGSGFLRCWSGRRRCAFCYPCIVVGVVRYFCLPAEWIYCKDG